MKTEAKLTIGIFVAVVVYCGLLSLLLLFFILS